MKNGWTIFGVIAIVVLVLLLCVGGGIVLAMGRIARGAGMMGRLGGYGMMTGVHPLGWIVPLALGLLLVAAIIALVVWYVRKNEKPNAEPVPAASSAPESALEIIKTRYAKGEITKEQFDAMKQDLT